MKILACSLMMRLNQVWFMGYVGGDTSIYLLYKIVRGDLRYFLKLDGILSWIVSVFIRIIVKVVTDLYVWSLRMRGVCRV